MSVRSNLLRATLIGALVGALAGELVPVPDHPAASPPSIAPRVAARASPPQPDPGRMPAYVKTALGRPLFRADRRPVSVAAAAPAAAAPAPVLPRLSGIMLSATGGEAIFEGAGKPVVAHVGDRLAGYTVAGIAAAGVTLQGPAGAQTILPAFDATRAPAPPAAPPPMQASTSFEQMLVNAPDLPIPPTPTLRTLAIQRRAMHAQP